MNEVAVKNLITRKKKISDGCYEFTYSGTYLENHFYKHGLVTKNDYADDLSNYKVLQFKVHIEQDTTFKVSIGLLKDCSPEAEKLYDVTTHCKLLGKGEKEISLPLLEFDFFDVQQYDLQFAREVKIEGDYPFEIKEAAFKKGHVISLECETLSKKADDIATYKIQIMNCKDEACAVELFYEPYGWEEMQVILSETEVCLKPYEIKEIEVKVIQSERIAPGGFEKQKIVARPNGQGQLSETITLITTKKLSHPMVLINQDEIEAVKEKVKKYEWAKETFEAWLALAYKWQVPVIDMEEPYLFITRNAHEARGTGIMYQLTGEQVLEEKVATFLKELVSDRGYLRLPRACNQELVHEGEFFKSVAIAYDCIYYSKLLSEIDHQKIETVLRAFIKVVDQQLKKGDISNWTLAEICGALYCSCVLQDRVLIERFLYGIGGASEHLSKGTLDDGWWYEVSMGYNLLCAGLFSEIAHVVSHLGIGFAHIKVPANYSKRVNSGAAHIDGLCHDVWGPQTKNYRSIEMLWDSLLPFYDYRGVLFGMNDSAESKVTGISHVLYDSRYDIAYYLYRKPEYAAFIKRLKPIERDLIFGVGELPDVQNESYKLSTYADNAGVAVLRSQAEGRMPREQIQVAVRYGSHGGAHGHYDRCSLLSLMRYGRSFYNPESIWYSYHTFMYKFYVQNSITHNMVTVDLKQQDPAPAERTLFYSGKMLQACEVQNIGKWCNPPYGGWKVNNDATLEERSWNEGRYLNVPKEHPDYASRSDFTEDILSKRLTLVFDDYIMNFDYVQGEEEHTYDCLYHIQGLRNIEGKALRLLRHTEQLDDNPLSSAQFITDCEWYEGKMTTKLEFEVDFSEDENNGGGWKVANRTDYNETGKLKLDLYTLQTSPYELMIGTPPEYHKVEKQLHYEVLGDEVTLAKGQFGAWVLGKDKLDIDVSKVKILTLKVKVENVLDENGKKVESKSTIFWGNPYFVKETGERIELENLDFTYQNTDKGKGVGKGYYGGTVKIQGESFEQAIPAEPLDRSKEGIIQINLEGLGAKRFVASIGGDYPLEHSEKRRRTISTRIVGKKARFTSLIEPYEESQVIQQVICEDADRIEVYLKDGRRQEIRITNFELEDLATEIEVKEYKEGNLLRAERNV